MHGFTHVIMGTLVVAGLVVTGHERLGGAPPPKGIALEPLGVFQAGVDGDPFLYDEGAVEIAAYDPASKRAFLTFAERPKVGIVDLSDPANPVEVLPDIDLTPWGGDEVSATSVAVSNGVVAVAVPRGEDDTDPGLVLFFDAYGTLLSEVVVGALPDMVTFTPNGDYVLTANEGQPNQAYTVDPEGSISVIDVRRGAANVTQADVSTVDFRAFNGAALDRSVRIFGPGATVAQDLEPEYIAVSHDSRTAWVTLQENNAIAVVDIPSRTVTSLKGLGFKDHGLAGQGLDGSRDDRIADIRPWPVRGMYQPDAIASFRLLGRTYLVTANEGDVREYDGLGAPNTSDPGVEAVEVEDIVLDPIAIPNAAALQQRITGIGRLKVSAFEGDVDGDGDYDALYPFGGRSFSILSADGSLVYDSGDALEQLIKATPGAVFNASNTNNTLDDRSDDKGPEPEGVTVASLFGRTYVFVLLERVGGVVVYEVIDAKAPRLVQYINTRDFTKAPNSGLAGDLGAEAARVVPAEFSPNGRPLLLVSNEVSGTLRVFEISATR